MQYIYTMVQALCRFLFRRPILFLMSLFSARPKERKVHSRLSALYQKISAADCDEGLTLTLEPDHKFVIISDLHKGNGNGADDFMESKQNYINALNYYYENGFTLIALGDIEELWENNISEVVATHNDTILLERKFVAENRLFKLFGNHDLYWHTNVESKGWLEKMYGTVLPIYEALRLKYESEKGTIHFYLTHGHQGDGTSDGSKFSEWFVANIWSKLQAYLDLKTNNPSKDYLLRNHHNKLMYKWSELQTALVLITGHTHKPVFESMSHIERLNKELEQAYTANNYRRIDYLEGELSKRKAEYVQNEPYSLKKPSYFNAGCCCYSDGDMTVLELVNGEIQLVKWMSINNNGDTRIVHEHIELNSLCEKLN